MTSKEDLDPNSIPKPNLLRREGFTKEIGPPRVQLVNHARKLPGARVVCESLNDRNFKPRTPLGMQPDPEFRKIAWRQKVATWEEPVDPMELEVDKVWANEGFRPAAVVTKKYGREATKNFGTQKGHVGTHALMKHFRVPYSSTTRSTFTTQALRETSALEQNERLQWNIGDKSVPEMTLNSTAGPSPSPGHRLW